VSYRALGSAAHFALDGVPAVHWRYAGPGALGACFRCGDEQRRRAGLGDHFRGQLGGQNAARGRWLLLLRVSVPAGQGRCGSFRDVLVVYGKEKVYGSIP